MSKKSKKVITDSSTVFNREAVQKAINIDPLKMINVLQESMAVGDKGEIPRNYADFLTSISLDDQEKLPLHNPADVGKLTTFLKDYNMVNDEYKVDKVLVFDTETTGYTGYVVSIAFVLYSIKEDKVLEEYYSLVNPMAPISADSIKVHKIVEEDIKDAKTFDQVWEEVKDLFGKADMAVGQNLSFDLKVLEREFERMNMPNPIESYFYFDTMKYGKAIAKVKDKNGKKIKDASLEELIQFFGIKLEDTTYHNALVDTKATLEVFKAMLNYV